MGKKWKEAVGGRLTTRLAALALTLLVLLAALPTAAQEAIPDTEEGTSSIVLLEPEELEPPEADETAGEPEPEPDGNYREEAPETTSLPVQPDEPEEAEASRPESGVQPESEVQPESLPFAAAEPEQPAVNRAGFGLADAEPSTTGISVTSVSDIQNELAALSAGDEITFLLENDLAGESLTVNKAVTIHFKSATGQEVEWSPAANKYAIEVSRFTRGLTMSFENVAIVPGSNAGARAVNVLRDTEVVLDGIVVRNFTTSGPVATQGALTITGNSLLENNNCGTGYMGGALSIGLDATETRIEGNTIFRGNYSGGGGAVYANSESELYIGGNAQFIGNGGWREGGAVYLRDTACYISGNVVFKDNYNDITSDRQDTSASGGALLILGAKLTIHGDGDSGILFEGNTTPYAGGAIGFDTQNEQYTEVPDVSITGKVAFVNNSATYHYFNIGNAYEGAYGGAISQVSSVYSSIHHPGYMYIAGDVVFSGNTAETAGGAIAMHVYGRLDVEAADGQEVRFTGNAAEWGGAVYVTTDSPTNIKGNVLFQGNGKHSSGISTETGGAIYASQSDVGIDGNVRFIENAAQYGGAVAMRQHDFPYVTKIGALSIVNGAEFRGNTAQYEGGALDVMDGKVTIRGSSFTGNIAMEGAAGAMLYLASNPDTISIQDTSFTGNQAADNGGALYLQAVTSATIEGSTFTGNKGYNGGAVFTGETQLTIAETTFGKNAASYRGGALYFNNAGATVRDSIFTGNTSANHGGAIYNQRGMLLDIGGETSFTENKAGNDGGAIFMYYTEDKWSNLPVGADVVFADNEAATAHYITEQPDIDRHNANVQATKFSLDFEYGYNNYDINYYTALLTKAVHRNGADIDGGEIEAGQTLTYSFTYRNGLETAANGTFEDVLPLGLAVVESSLPAGFTHTVNGAGRVVVSGPLEGKSTSAPGFAIKEEVSFSFDVLVQPEADGWLVNEASITRERKGLGYQTIQSNQVRNRVRLPLPAKITKLAMQGNEEIERVKLGDTFAYVLLLENPNPDKPLAVQVTDTLPEKVRYLNHSGDTPGTVLVDEENGGIIWDVTLAAGGKAELTITVKATESGKKVLNTAIATSNTGDEENNTSRDDAEVDINLKPATIDKQAVQQGQAVEVVEAGKIFQYQITVRNPNTEPLEVTVVDELPQEVRYQSHEAADGDAVCKDGVVTWNVTVPAGDSCVLVVTVLAETAGEDVENTATVTSKTGEEEDEEDEDKATVDIEEPLQPATIQKQALQHGVETTRVMVGESFQYTLTLNNPNEKPLEVQVKDSLPAEVSYQGHETARGSVREENGEITWSLTMAAGETTTLTITVTATKVKKNVENTAVATSKTGEDEEESRESKVDVDIDDPEPVKEISKQIFDGSDFVDQYTVKDPSEVLTYRVSVALPDDLAGYTSLRIEDLLPEELKLATGSPAADIRASVRGESTVLTGTAGYDAALRIAYYSLSDFTGLAGKTIDVEFDTKLADEGYTGPIENTGRAVVNKEPGDVDYPDPGTNPENPDKETPGPDVDVEPKPEPEPEPVKEISKQIFDGSDFVDQYTVKDPGEVLTYRVSVALPDDLAGYTSLRIEDLLPEELKLATGSPAADIRAGVRGESTVLTGTAGYDDALRIAYYSLSDFTGLAGKTIDVEFDTKLADEGYTGPIENTGRAIVNKEPGDVDYPDPGTDPENPDKETPGPDVDVEPKPEPEPEAPTKTAVDVNDEPVDAQTKVKVGDRVNYRITYDVPQGAVSIRIEDRLPEGVKVAGSDPAGKRIENTYVWEITVGSERDKGYVDIVLLVESIPSGSESLVNSAKVTYVYEDGETPDPEEPEVKIPYEPEPDPSTSQPGGEDSTTSKPGGGDSTTSKPGGGEDSTTSKPGGGDSTTSKPGGEDSTTSKPGGGDSTTSKPGGGEDSTTSKPGGGDSTTSQPGGEDSTTSKPGGGDSTTSKPGGGEDSTTSKPGGGDSTTSKPGGGEDSTTSKPGGGDSTTSKPGGEDSTTSKPGGGDSTTSKPGGGEDSTTSKPGGGDSTTSKPGGGEDSTTSKPGGGDSTTSKPGGEDSTTSKPGGGDSTTSKPGGGEDSTTSKPGGGDSTTSKPGGGEDSTTSKPGGGSSTTSKPNGGSTTSKPSTSGPSTSEQGGVSEPDPGPGPGPEPTTSRTTSRPVVVTPTTSRTGSTSASSDPASNSSRPGSSSSGSTGSSFSSGSGSSSTPDGSVPNGGGDGSSPDGDGSSPNGGDPISSRGGLFSAGGGLGDNPTVQELIDETGSVDVFGNPVPMGSFAVRGGWSLVSLLLSILSLLSAVVMFVRLLRNKKQEEPQQEYDEDGEPIVRYNEDGEPEEEEQRYKTRRLRMFLATLSGVLPLLLFLILENLRSPMVLLTRWTPLIFVVTLLHFALVIIQMVRRRVEDEEEEQEENIATV